MAISEKVPEQRYLENNLFEVCYKDRVFLVPAYPVRDVCDPTGAGDSFAGGMMGRLAAGNAVDGAAVRDASITLFCRAPTGPIVSAQRCCMIPKKSSGRTRMGWRR